MGVRSGIDGQAGSQRLKDMEDLPVAPGPCSERCERQQGADQGHAGEVGALGGRGPVAAQADEQCGGQGHGG